MTTVNLPITISNDQALAIMNEALAREFFERDVDGNAPRDPAVIMDVASELVRQATLSYRAGNRSDGVVAILSIAEVDMNQPIEHDRSDRSEGGQSSMATTAAQMQDDIKDEAKYPKESLYQYEKALMNYPLPHGEGVETNLKIVRDELERRGLPTALQMMHANGAPVAPEPVTAQVPQIAPSPAPAPAPPPQPTAQQEVAVDPLVPTEEQRAERVALMDRLTFPMMRANSLDPSQVDLLTMDELREVVEGVVPPSEAATPAPVPVSDIGGVELRRQAALSSQDPDAISAEREELEGRVTGPMLKLYRRGRTDVPGIGDNELRLMVDNPEGRITQVQLDAARAADGGGTPAPEINPNPPSATPSTHREPLQPAQADAAADQVRDEARDGQVQQGTINYTETAPVLAPVPVQAPSPPGPPAPSAFAPPPPPPEPVKTPKPAPAPVQQAPLSEPVPVDIEGGRADAIIARERFPLPPEIDGDPPVLPADLSQLGRDQLYSMHARFHALESRVGWVLGLEEDELANIVKLRRGREVEVANSLPPKVGTSKMTESQRDSLVAADEGVKQYLAAEHEQKKGLRKLAYLYNDFHKSVGVCSRQMTRWDNEMKGAGR